MKNISRWLVEIPYDGPTSWAMDHFILGREGLTDWGRFRQALREVAARRTDDPNERPSQRLRRDRELAHFELRATELGDQLEREHGQLTEGLINSLDEDHWTAKARLMVAMDLLTMGRISPTTADMMLALCPVARASLLDLTGLNPLQLQAEVVKA